MKACRHHADDRVTFPAQPQLESYFLADRVPPQGSGTLFFDPGAIGALKETLVAYLENRGEITVPEFKDMTGGLSRKYVIPLLEHFDMSKVTLRIGDKRVLRKGK